LTLFQILRDYSSMNGGYFRPLYAFFVYLTYGTFQHDPKLFYLFNLAFVLMALWPWTLLINRHLAPESCAELTFTFVFLLFCATPLYNHITYLSLQEKFVIFFSGWSYYFFDRTLAKPMISGPHWWTAQAALIMMSVLGLWGKATYVAFIPWFAVALVAAKGLPVVRKGITLAVWCVFLSGMGYVLLHNRSIYNSKYKTDIHGLLDRIHLLPPSVYFFLALAILTGMFLLLRKQKDAALWVWPLSLLSYLFVMLPWGINTYYWGPAMPSACGCLVLLAEGCLQRSSRHIVMASRGLLSISALLAAMAVFYIGIPRLARQSEIGSVVQWLSARLPNPKVTVFVQEPCLEATGTLQYYAGGRQPFQYLKRGQTPASTTPEWWLITRDECVMDAGHAPLFDHVVYELPHWKIYARVEPA
jgi:hypothetical protein